jgi:hypothetical protein
MYYDEQNAGGSNCHTYIPFFNFLSGRQNLANTLRCGARPSHVFNPGPRPGEKETSMSNTLEANRKAVLESYDLALNKKDADAAFKYLGPTYTQHNPTVADGFDGWRAMVAWLKKDRPNFKVEVKRVIAEPDFVMLHVPGDNL